MLIKSESSQKMKKTAPHLAILEKYVKKRIACNTFNIKMSTPLNYEFTVIDVIDMQLNDCVSFQKNVEMILVEKNSINSNEKNNIAYEANDSMKIEYNMQVSDNLKHDQFT